MDKILAIEKNEKNNKYYINCKHYQKNFDLSSEKKGAFMVYRTRFFNNDKDNKNKFYKLDKGDINLFSYKNMFNKKSNNIVVLSLNKNFMQKFLKNFIKNLNLRIYDFIIFF